MKHHCKRQKHLENEVYETILCTFFVCNFKTASLTKRFYIFLTEWLHQI